MASVHYQEDSPAVPGGIHLISTQMRNSCVFEGKRESFI